MEVAFLCEMEMVTVIPRQRLESLNLLGVSSDPANPSNSLYIAIFTPIEVVKLTLNDRDQLLPFVHLIEHLFHSGSLFFSSANVAQISSLRHGSSPPHSTQY
jgi:hypothetical protein